MTKDATYHSSMIEARRNMGRLVATKTNYHGGKYADLSDVLDVINGPLLEVGLLLEQFPGVFNGTVTVDTVITHAATGHQEVHSYGMPIQQQTAQGIGSAITYARRYALTSIFGLAPEDDDGETASRPQPQRQPRRQPPPPAAGPETLAEVPPVDGGVVAEEKQPQPDGNDWPADTLAILETLRADAGNLKELQEEAYHWASWQPKWNAEKHLTNAWKKHIGTYPYNKTTARNWIAGWIAYVMAHEDAAKPWQPEGEE